VERLGRIRGCVRDGEEGAGRNGKCFQEKSRLESLLKGGFPMPRNIASGQRINESKYLEAKILRRTMTPAEKRLWVRMRKNQLDGFHFRRQQIIAGFIVDFYCHEASLIVEIDGPVHKQNKKADSQRETILRAMGFRIIRFGNEEVMENIEKVVSEIEGCCVSDTT
jgi:very-short-patch-repair endonuclease